MALAWVSSSFSEVTIAPSSNSIIQIKEVVDLNYSDAVSVIILKLRLLIPTSLIFVPVIGPPEKLKVWDSPRNSTTLAVEVNVLSKYDVKPVPTAHQTRVEEDGIILMALFPVFFMVSFVIADAELPLIDRVVFVLSSTTVFET